MNESQLRDLLGKGLPKIASASVNAMYPVGFKAEEERPRDYTVDAQVVSSQLLYTRNLQILSFLIMDASQIFKLGHRVFPKYSRAEIPKMVVSANGEALNTIMGKVAYLVSKVEQDAEVTTAPPILLNCTGPNRVVVHGADGLFLKLASLDLTILVIASIQHV